MNNWHSALKQTGEVHACMVFQQLLRIFKRKDQLVSMSAEIRPISRQEKHCFCIAMLCIYHDISCITIIMATLLHSYTVPYNTCILTVMRSN